MAKKSSSKTSQKLTVKRLLILSLLLIIALSFFGYRLYRQYEVDSYLRKVEKIEEEANKNLIRLNRDFSQFQGDPTSAAKVLPKFKEGKEVLRKSVKELEGINPPKKGRKLHRSLITLYAESSNFCGDLEKIAKFIIERGKLMRKLVLDFENFSSSVKQAKGENQVTQAVKSFAGGVDETLSKLRKLETQAPAILPYSNKTLELNLEELSLSLDQIRGGIEANNISQVDSGTSRFSSVLSRDWAKALTEGDKKGIEKYKRRVKELEHLREVVVMQDEKLRKED